MKLDNFLDHKLMAQIATLDHLENPYTLEDLYLIKGHGDLQTQGFNFLAYPIAGNRLTIARSALDRYQARLLWLVEPRPRSHRLKQYISHWIQWATSAVAFNIKQLLQTIHKILHTTIVLREQAIVLE